MINSNASGQLSESLKRLQVIWQEAAEHWQDETREAFAQSHFSVLCDLTDDALTYLHEIEYCIQQALRTCQ